jgi:ABC-type phosphate transport system substrate-binding protein
MKLYPSRGQMDELMDRAKLPSRLTYRAVGSSTGQAEFKGNDTTTFVPENDFASGDIPITTEDYEEFKANNISIVHLPVVVSAVSLFHSIPYVPEGGNGLNLTSCLIAKIFSLEITDWLDPAITAENPNLRSMIGQDSFPITVGRRSLGSSSTSSVTAVSQCLSSAGAPAHV